MGLNVSSTSRRPTASDSVTRVRILHLIGISLLLWSPAAHAQDFKPRVLLIFDTSGSMGVGVETGLESGGDNSREHPGNGAETRLFAAKNAMVSILQTTSEVSFGLMRYPQFEGPGINRGAVDGFSFNTYDGLEDTPLNYGGTCEGALRGEGSTSLIVPFAEGNEREIVSWMNNQEDYPGDKELRADGPTPIAETMTHAREYLAELALADPLARCRSNVVVVLSDGGESCVPFAEREAAMAAAGASLRAIEIDHPQEGQINLDVKTYVVAFAVNERGLNQLGALARAGGTAINPAGFLDLEVGGAYQASDSDGLREAFGRILVDAIPFEICDGVDDDCDGAIDEGVTNSCGVCGEDPVEECNGEDEDCDGRIDEGVLNACGRCGPVPEEACNTLDDDCDGAIDENVANACGGCADVEDEVCNNLDDDCDGFVDNLQGEETPIFQDCGADIGECTVGRSACVNGDWGACDGTQPSEEACDSLDNDCDGLADEATLPCGASVELGGEVGECRFGARRCDLAVCEADAEACGPEGYLLACEEAVDPSEEVCNGRDDDCDGEADEGLFNSCGACGPTPPEACNGVDDNCDGRIDEDARCPPGHLCYAAECVQPCDASGECRGGFACLEVYAGGRFCHPNACAGARCPNNSRCDVEAQTCIELCGDAGCGEDEGCDLGACVEATCRHTGCPEGERCFASACEPDPCAGVACEEDEFCREGDCVGACRDTACGEGRACVDGECQDDPCGGLCLRGQRCDPSDGLCVIDPCLEVACPAGMACELGECRDDAPCVAIHCPGGTICIEGRCTDQTPGVVPSLGQRPPRRDAGPVSDGGVDAAVVDAAVDAETQPEDEGVEVDQAVPDASGGGGGDTGICAARPGKGAGWGWALLLLAGLLRSPRRAPRGSRRASRG